MMTYAFAPLCSKAFARALPLLLEAAPEFTGTTGLGPEMVAVLKNMSDPTYLQRNYGLEYGNTIGTTKATQGSLNCILLQGCILASHHTVLYDQRVLLGTSVYNALISFAIMRCYEDNITPTRQGVQVCNVGNDLAPSHLRQLVAAWM